MFLLSFEVGFLGITGNVLVKFYLGVTGILFVIGKYWAFICMRRYAKKLCEMQSLILIEFNSYLMYVYRTTGLNKILPIQNDFSKFDILELSDIITVIVFIKTKGVLL